MLQLLQFLEQPRRPGKGWTVRSRQQDDKNPSLPVAGRGDKILIHWPAGLREQS